MSLPIALGCIIAALVVGCILGGLYRKKVSEREIGSAEEKAKQIINDAYKSAESKRRETLLEAKEEIHKSRTEYEREVKERRAELQKQERRLQQKEETLDRKTDTLDKKTDALNQKIAAIDTKQNEINQLKKTQMELLEKISGYTVEEAKAFLINSLKDDVVHEQALMVKEVNIVIILCALFGACLGFIPYNMNPAKIFMGDTGSTFLGYILATLSITGLFKMYAIISFAVPFLILGIPIFDISFAFLRRIAHGQNPMKADRGHFHHRLIDMGFSQKQAVAIAYMLTGILGLAAVLLTSSGELKALILIAAIFIVSAIGFKLIFSKNDPAEDASSPEPEEKQEEPHE